MPIIRLPKLKGFLTELLCIRRDALQATQPATPQPATGDTTTTNTRAATTTTPDESGHTAVQRPVPIHGKRPVTGDDVKKQDENETTDVHDGEQEPPLEECPICHDLVGVPNPEGILESWVHLHCGHKFGSSCIQCWVDESAEIHPMQEPSCPICRTTARHPCGHPIVTPVRGVYLGVITPGRPPLIYEPRHPRPRRRLTRREGHPNRPPPPPPHSTNPRVQMVGKCRYCAILAAQEERRKKRSSTTGRPDTSGSSTTESERGPGVGDNRRPRSKSVMLQTTSFQRLSVSSPSEEPRDEMTAHFSDMLTYYADMCRTHHNSRIAERVPTPGPTAADRIEAMV
ncbi:hypothetical protein F5Y08DRAFT_59795 [Xylaria arbuscula]|nr:hypothetical protein F5Y08DRAFT_59795 [Xylaria arbuscula]